MKNRRRLLLVVAVAATLMLSAFADFAWAATWRGHMDGWTPRGDAAVSESTPFTFRRGDHGAVRSFRVSNAHTRFIDLSDGHRVSRNTFFRDLSEDASDEVVVTWKWKRDSAGNRYRYVKRIGLTE